MLGEEAIPTPYAQLDVRVLLCRHESRKFVFLQRHGEKHGVPPHKINYRANVWALHQLSVTKIASINAVGGIHAELAPGNLAVPDQIIDYTSGREATFHDEFDSGVRHIDFTQPYDPELRMALLRACRTAHPQGMNVMDGGVYACSNGPRLETAAEILRMQHDGCDMVGMTGMPEAALAREAGIAYAALALSVNRAAGLGTDVITMDDIHRVLEAGVARINLVLQALVLDAAD